MYREQVFLGRGVVVEVVFAGEKQWKLSLRRGGKVVVEHSPATRTGFRSVEQLRYEFERDVENALRQDR